MDNNYIKDVIKENYDCMSQKIDFETWLKTELKNNPESFDCFFKQAWDEISEKKKTKRIEIIENVFKN